MASERRNPVAWTEGMFLRPQHLQQQELYFQTRLHDHLRTLDPFHWGIRELQIDEEALSDHRFEILRLDAILPDGTQLRYPGNALLEAREFDPASESLDVWVALRRIQRNEPVSAPLEEGARGVRYKVREEEIPDLHRVGSEAPIDALVPNVRVFLSGQETELDAHESLHIARVVATGELRRPFRLAPDFAPALLALQAHPPLEEEVAKLTSQLAAKVRVVSGRTATVAVADLPRYWMRYTLARATPLLRHLLSTGATHPFPLYTALVEIAGSLAAFALAEPAELPLYRHDDPYPCFRRLLEFIDVHLEAVLPVRYRELKLSYETAEGRQYYVTRELSLELVDPRSFFFVGIKAALDSKELRALVKESGKAASAKDMWTLRQFQLEGLRLEPLPGSPTEIAAPLGFEWFGLEPRSNDRLWGGVRDDMSFALSLGKLESADVRLYVVTQEG